MIFVPKRTIEHAVIDGVGPISTKWLLSQPEDGWGILRQSITDGWNDKPQRIVAKCLMCGSPVYIRVTVLQGQPLPGFSHYAGGDETCPWYSGPNTKPDDVKKQQYGGKQESLPHRFLCEEIATQAQRDERCELTSVDQYLEPCDQNTFGRYPDTFVQFKDGRKFVFEVQLSHTQQPEISGRALHYCREGIPLIWVLHGIDTLMGPLPQCFRDVILRHRNNAFVIDDEAIAEAKKRNTVVLKCFFLLPSGRFDAGRLINLDELTYPLKGLPFFQDRLSPVLLAPAQAARTPWWNALKRRVDKTSDIDFKSSEFSAAFEDLCHRVEGLGDWCKRTDRHQTQIGNLVCILFSAVTHAKGDFKNYSSSQPNVTAMLNSKVVRSDLAVFAPIVETLLKNSPGNALLKGSVGTHIDRAKAAYKPSLAMGTPPWEAVKTLLPEIFDPFIREQLSAFGGLPSWASPQYI